MIITPDNHTYEDLGVKKNISERGFLFFLRGHPAFTTDKQRFFPKLFFPARESDFAFLLGLKGNREFVAVCEFRSPQAYMESYRWVGNGCPPASRLALCKAFIAKAVWDFPTTRDLVDAVRHRPTLRHLCGWETLKKVPSESTFSRVFAVFAEDHPPQHCFLRFCKRIEKSFV